MMEFTDFATGKKIKCKRPPAPRFSVTSGEPALSTIYGDHHFRMLAVIAAARTGNHILIELALANYDAKGCEPEPQP